MQTQAEWNAEMAARAVAYSATIFANRRYITHRFATLAEAEEAARILTASASNGRKAMVYAITEDDFTIYLSTPS